MRTFLYLPLVFLVSFAVAPFQMTLAQEKSDFEVRQETRRNEQERGEDMRRTQEEMRLSAAEDDRLFSFLIGKLRGMYAGKSDLEMFFDLFEKQKYSEAAGYIEKVLRQDEKNSAAQYYRGVVYNKTKQYNYATSGFDRALQLGFDKEKCYLGRAYAYKMQGAYGAALVDYNDALEWDKSSPDIYRMRGMLNYRMTNYDDAIKDLEKAIFLDPIRKSESDGYLQLSRAMYKADSSIQAYYLKNEPKTIEGLKEALKKSPKSVHMYTKLALMNLHLSNWPEAMSALTLSRSRERILDSSFEKRQRDRTYYWGIIYNRTIEGASARQCLKQLRTGEQYLCLEADIFITRGEYEKAIANCTELISKYQPAPAYYNQRGYAQFKLGQFALAINDFDLAKKSKMESFFPDYDYRTEAALALKEQKSKPKK